MFELNYTSSHIFYSFPKSVSILRQRSAAICLSSCVRYFNSIRNCFLNYSKGKKIPQQKAIIENNCCHL